MTTQVRSHPPTDRTYPPVYYKGELGAINQTHPLTEYELAVLKAHLLQHQIQYEIGMHFQHHFDITNFFKPRVISNNPNMDTPCTHQIDLRFLRNPNPPAHPCTSKNHAQLHK